MTGRSRSRVVSTGSVNSRAHHSNVLPGEEGDPVLSRGSSVSVAGNGPAHRFAQPRRTPLARSDLGRSYGADATRPTAIFLPIFFFPLSLPLPFSLYSSFLLLFPSSFRYTHGVYAPARILIRQADTGDRSPPRDAGDVPGKTDVRSRQGARGEARRNPESESSKTRKRTKGRHSQNNPVDASRFVA